MNSNNYTNVTRTREKQLNKKKKSSKIKKITYMIISIIICAFVIHQMYFLVKYTMGEEINTKNLVIYRWINKIENDDLVNDYTNEEKTTQEKGE